MVLIKYRCFALNFAMILFGCGVISFGGCKGADQISINRGDDCIQSTDCDEGEVCEDGNCIDDSACRRDDDCPISPYQICVDGMCVSPEEYACDTSAGEGPLMVVSTLAHDFGDVGLSSPAVLEIEIENQGACLLTLTGIGFENGTDSDFGCDRCSVEDYPYAVAPNRSLILNIDITPTSAGTKAGALLINGDDDVSFPNDGIARVELSAQHTGEARLAADPPILDFGFVDPDVAHAFPIQLRNLGTGSAVAVIQSATVRSSFGGALSLSDISGTTLVPYDNTAGSEVDLMVYFDAQGDVVDIDTVLSIQYNDRSLDVPLFGSSRTPPDIHLVESNNGATIDLNGPQLTSLTFNATNGSPLPLGSAITETFGLTNVGGSPLDVESISFLGDGASEFSVAPVSYAALGQGSGVNIPVTYIPSTVIPGGREVTMQVSSNDPDEPVITIPIVGYSDYNTEHDYLVVTMDYAHAPDNFSGGYDFRNVNLSLEGPDGVVFCGKPETNVDANTGAVAIDERCSWTTPYGSAEWYPTNISYVADRIPIDVAERVIVRGLPLDGAADGSGQWQVKLTYTDDCKRRAVDSDGDFNMIDILDIGEDVLIQLGNSELEELGLPGFIPDNIITDNLPCLNRDGVDVDVSIRAGGDELFNDVVRVDQLSTASASTTVPVKLLRQNNRFVTVP